MSEEGLQETSHAAPVAAQPHAEYAAPVTSLGGAAEADHHGSDVGAGHAQSGQAVGAGGGGGGMMPSSITGENSIGVPCSGSLDGILSAGSLDGITTAFGHDVNFCDAFEGNMAAGGISHESIPPMTNEITKAGLETATGVTTNLNAKLPTVVPGAGQEAAGHWQGDKWQQGR